MKYVDIVKDEKFTVLEEAVSELTLTKEAKETLQRVDPTADYSGLIKEAFADEENRMFPLSTPEDTVMSTIYFLKQAEYIDDEKIPQKISESLNEWGIDYISVADIKKEASVIEAEVEDFLLPSKKKLPVVDEESLLKSAQVFTSHIKSLNIREKAEGACNLKKYAEDFGIDFGQFGREVETYAMSRGSDLNKLSLSIIDRMERLDESLRPDYKIVLNKIASIREDAGEVVHPNTVLGLFSTLIDLDKTAELNEVFDPFVDVFNADLPEQEVIEKVAAQEMIEVGNYDIPLVKIASMSGEEAIRKIGNIAQNFIEEDSVDVDRFETFVSEITLPAKNSIAERIIA